MNAWQIVMEKRKVCAKLPRAFRQDWWTMWPWWVADTMRPGFKRFAVSALGFLWVFPVMVVMVFPFLIVETILEMAGYDD